MGSNPRTSQTASRRRHRGRPANFWFDGETMPIGAADARTRLRVVRCWENTAQTSAPSHASLYVPETITQGNASTVHPLVLSRGVNQTSARLLRVARVLQTALERIPIRGDPERADVAIATNVCSGARGDAGRQLGEHGGMDPRACGLGVGGRPRIRVDTASTSRAEVAASRTRHRTSAESGVAAGQRHWLAGDRARCRQSLRTGAI
jgi:hypothetical protein